MWYVWHACRKRQRDILSVVIVLAVLRPLDYSWLFVACSAISAMLGPHLWRVTYAWTALSFLCASLFMSHSSMRWEDSVWLASLFQLFFTAPYYWTPSPHHAPPTLVLFRNHFLFVAYWKTSRMYFQAVMLCRYVFGPCYSVMSQTKKSRHAIEGPIHVGVQQVQETFNYAVRLGLR